MSHAVGWNLTSFLERTVGIPSALSCRATVRNRGSTSRSSRAGFSPDLVRAKSVVSGCSSPRCVSGSADAALLDIGGATATRPDADRLSVWGFDRVSSGGGHGRRTPRGGAPSGARPGLASHFDRFKAHGHLALPSSGHRHALERPDSGIKAIPCRHRKVGTWAARCRQPVGPTSAPKKYLCVAGRLEGERWFNARWAALFSGI